MPPKVRKEYIQDIIKACYKMIRESHEAAINHTQMNVFYPDLVETANRMLMDLVWTGEIHADTRFFLSGTGDDWDREVNDWVAYIEWYLKLFCKGKKITLTLRVDD